MDLLIKKAKITVLDKYEVTPERAAEDVDNLLKVWIEQGVAEA